jgi:hypothetical protein
MFKGKALGSVEELRKFKKVGDLTVVRVKAVV